MKKKEGEKEKKNSSKISLKYLKKLSKEKYFYVKNGMVIRNLEELLMALDLMEQETFDYHVNRNKNDFSKWVKHIIKDYELSDNISHLRSKNSMEREIIKRIKGIHTEEKPIHFMRHAALEFAYGLIAGIVLGLLVAAII